MLEGPDVTLPRRRRALSNLSLRPAEWAVCNMLQSGLNGNKLPRALGREGYSKEAISKLPRMPFLLAPSFFTAALPWPGYCKISLSSCVAFVDAHCSLISSARNYKGSSLTPLCLIRRAIRRRSFLASIRPARRHPPPRVLGPKQKLSSIFRVHIIYPYAPYVPVAESYARHAP
jgi:hypothetical protein